MIIKAAQYTILSIAIATDQALHYLASDLTAFMLDSQGSFATGSVDFLTWKVRKILQMPLMHAQCSMTL